MTAGEDARSATKLADEDAARANFYALIGRLFYDAPDSIFLAELCRAGAQGADQDTALGRAWQALQEACKCAYPAVIKQEYDNLFVGVGKAEVTPYTSHYVSSPDRHLVQLREGLERLRLVRRSAAFEVEDHVSGICDVMRFLAADGRSLDEQRLFFNEFAYRGIAPFCAAVAASASAVFYRHVAHFAREFLELERQAFDMQDDGA